MFQRLLKHKLLIVITLAVIARIAVLLAFPGVFAFDQTGAIHGSDAYDTYAMNIVETGVFGRAAGVPDAAIPPMYSYALAVVYAIFGRGYMQLGLFHTLLDALSIWMLYEIVRRLFKNVENPAALWGQPIGEMVGVFAGLFYAVYPYLIFQNLTVIDTPFFMTLLHAFVLLVILLRDRERLDAGTWGLAFFTGIILGVATLTRPITPPLALMVALWYLFRLNLKQSFLRLLPVAFMSVMVLVPWIVRNFNDFDIFIPMTTTSGANLWQGNSKWTIPVFKAGYDVQWTKPENIDGDIYDYEADRERFAASVDFWKENPEKIPELLWVKFLVHWSIDIAPRYNPQEGEQFFLNDAGELEVRATGEDIDGVNAANTAYDEPLFDVLGRWIHRFYFGTSLLLAIIGVWLSRRYWRDVSLLWFVQISMTLIYMVFHPSTRYRAPSDPLLFAFSAFTVVMILMWLMSRRSTRLEASTESA